MAPGLSLAEKLDWMENATVEQREAELEERTIAGADQAKEQGFGDGWGFLRDIGQGVLATPLRRWVLTMWTWAWASLTWQCRGPTLL